MIFSKSNLYVLTFLLLFFVGCGKQPTIITKEVLIPIKCEAEVPPRPTKVDDNTQNIINILEYTEKLEKIIQACVNSK